MGRALFAETEVLLQIATVAVTFAVTTILFALIYKVLPNTKTAGAEIWWGAAITAGLFELGKFLIGLYIGKSSVGTAFGAASPFVVLMLWIYYSTQVFLFGAEITAAHAGHGKKSQSRTQ